MDNNGVNKLSEMAGMAPGVAIPVDVDPSVPSKFVVSCLQHGQVTTQRLGSLRDEFPEHPAGSVLWIDVQGYSGLTSISKIFAALQVHPMLQADILNTKHRTKMDILDDTLFVVVKRLVKSTAGRIRSEQVSFLAKGNVIVTFQPVTEDSFEGVRKRLPLFKEDKATPSYVLYALLDNVVDNFFGVVEYLQAAIEKTEKHLLSNDAAMDRGSITILKRDITLTRHVIWPIKNVIINIRGDKEDFFPPEMDIYLRDLKDHILQLDEACELCYEGVNSVIQLNMDNINTRTKETRKTVALISTVFLPLTFIAGVYGMNFEFMPELRSPWGYPLVLGMMAAIALLLYRSFKSRNWLN